ncbi:hypothetical protein T12_2385 [Trichinella patagoniensis]|uniref:Uncharacterized protein n=1 Tax=Trichinella patagoniensis TaxID=990121 RepID=A0A0V0YUD3_9BILA|nr:hypothetical protein T12_2385 [Trichinella patagoniensis]
MPCLHKQGTYHRNDFAQDATPDRKHWSHRQ